MPGAMKELAARIKAAEACARKIAGKDNEEALLDATVQVLTAAVFELFSAESDGTKPALDPKDAKILSETLRNLALARKTLERKEIERKEAPRREADPAALLDRVRAVYQGEG